MDPPPGAAPGPRRRRDIDWELVTCGVRGHRLVGTEARLIRPQDDLVARELDGIRFHRCLRCDAWVALDPPATPATEYPPDRDQIEIPLRGKALRDRVVLRLIACDRVLHFTILVLLGVAVLIFTAHERNLRGSYYKVLTALQSGIAGGPVQMTGHVGIGHTLDHLFTLRSGRLHEVGIALLLFGLLEGVEAVGLWKGKRWAEYLTFLATALLLPLEIHELAVRITVLKLLGFLINLAIVVYLVYAKRLFGLRGGGAVDERERAAATSWAALEAATPAAASPS
jgi:uncharacterized membrane protein (DUF2068 family)